MGPGPDRGRQGAGGTALSSGQIGLYTLQAAIAAVHADADTPAATDWAQIVALYDVLAQSHPSPVVELEPWRGDACDGPAAGWSWSTPSWRGAISPTTTWRTRRADLCRRLGRTAEARFSTTAGAQPDATGA